MSMQVTREQVWVAEIDDAPGGLAAKLTPLAEAGVNLGFVVARRSDTDDSKGVVFVTPILAMFVLLQRRIVAGLTSGALK